MLVTALLCILIGFSSAQTYNKNHCGLRPLVTRDDDKVVGGVQSKVGDWPWSCSMRAPASHICGGSIINGRFIVTAAHCVGSTSPSNYRWYCGLHHRNNHEEYTRNFLPTRVIVHPSYNSRLIQNDIALFQIAASDITYDKYVLPVCIPKSNVNYEYKTSIGMGWGTLSSGGSAATVHMEVAMPILNDTNCKNKFGANLLPASQICAGVSGANKDTCQGDSGGPLVVKHDDDGNWYLAGLTSWGYGCGDGGVYTRLSAFLSWIQQNAGELPDGTGKV